MLSEARRAAGEAGSPTLSGASLLEVEGGDDVGAGPGELRDAVLRALAKGSGEVYIDAGGGACEDGRGVVELGDGDVEVALVAIDVADARGDFDQGRGLVPLLAGFVADDAREFGLHGGRGLEQREGMHQHAGRVDGEGYGVQRATEVRCAEKRGDFGIGYSLGGDDLLEGGADLVAEIAGGGHGAAVVERDAAIECGAEVVVVPPDEVAKAGWEQRGCGGGFEGVGEDRAVGLKCHLVEEAGVAETLGCVLDLLLSGVAGFEAAEGEEFSLGVVWIADEFDLGEDDLLSVDGGRGGAQAAKQQRERA